MVALTMTLKTLTSLLTAGLKYSACSTKTDDDITQLQDGYIMHHHHILDIMSAITSTGY